MSDEVPADIFARHINRAIEAALAEMGGGFPHGFAGVIDYIDNEGNRTWSTVFADDQTPMTSLGILRFGTMSVESQVNEYLRRAEEEE